MANRDVSDALKRASFIATELGELLLEQAKNPKVSGLEYLVQFTNGLSDSLKNVVAVLVDEPKPSAD